MKKKKSQKSRIKRPGKVTYALLGGLLWLYAVFFKKHKLVTELPDGLEPPYIIIGNHTSFYDFAYAVRAFYPERISFVVARKYFHYAGLSLVMKTARAIPKSLFQPDTGTIVAMFNILKQGGVIGIFPEGQISLNGTTISYGETTAKFIKKAGVPVVRLLTGGAYFVNPPWAKNTRKGPIESSVSLMLTKEQTQELSTDAIMERIQHGLYMDSFAWQETTGGVYRGEMLAHGLENMLYICPSCREEFSFTAEGNTICCRSCGTQAYFGEDGHLSWIKENYFRHIGDWHNWQIEQETGKIVKDEVFSVSEPVVLAMLRLKGKGITVVGSGTFTVSRDAYVYSGTLRGQTVRLTFSTTGIRYLPIDTGRNFQIYHKDLLYEFRPENPVWCMKISNICEGIHALPDKNSTDNALPLKQSLKTT